MAPSRDSEPSIRLAGLALLGGILAVQGFPALPHGFGLYATVAALAALAVLGFRRRRWRLAACLLAGIGWAMLRGAWAMDARLPLALEGQDLVVDARVIGLPRVQGDGTRLELAILAARHDGVPLRLRGRVRVAWYDDAPAIGPCDTWRLRLRLKRPRAMLDPGGSDSERSALARGTVGVGYVRAAGPNRRLARGACVDRLRAWLVRGIAAQVAGPHDAALLRALAVGDTRGLSPDDWAVARIDGISHLLAISGFHVGVAGALGAGLAGLLYAMLPSLALRLPGVQARAAAAFVAASGYGVLAGLGLPTQRTLLMIAVVVLARLRRRTVRPADALALALAGLLLADPLAVLAAGFWLSFVGVAFLMFCLEAPRRGWRGALHDLGASQWAMSVALLPLTLWFFGQASLVGALANLVAVPVVSFVLVPLALLGLLALPCPFLAAPLWRLAAVATHGLWQGLAMAARWPGASWYLPAVAPWAVALATAGAAWLLAPKGVPSRWLGALLFLPLLWPASEAIPAAGYRVWMFDVGQGLSVLVRTRGHALLYDAGARYPSGFDVGEAVVVPSLRALGVRRLDALVISHADNDHAGGAGAVLAAYAPARRLAGEPARMPMPMAACVAGQAWRWDGVDFRMLGPVGGERAGNDRSCVLLVDGGGDRLLLTGDITRRVEPRIAAAVPAGGPLLVSVPHHGSATSSSDAFLRRLRPRLALVSAGWRNRFGHPRADVMARYAALAIPRLLTARDGALRIDVPPTGHAAVRARLRRDRRRYWREKGAGDGRPAVRTSPRNRPSGLL